MNVFRHIQLNLVADARQWRLSGCGIRIRASRWIGRSAVSVLLGMIVVTALLAVIGCEEDVTAVLGTDQSFSLYGVLTPQLDSQWVRVYPIEDRLEPDTTDRLDATLISTDLDTGEEYVWQDSLIQDVFNQMAHVFWAPFTAEYEHRYRLVVRRSDGAESQVEVTVPPRTEIVPREPATSFSTVLPVHVEGDAPRLLNVIVEYSVSFQREGLPNQQLDEVSIPYHGRVERRDGGWVVPITMSSDFNTINEVLATRLPEPIDRGVGILLLHITLRLVVANEEWNPPDGVFDVAVLVQPGTMDNVRGGFGFVGAGYRHEKSWAPPKEVTRAAGFRPVE